MGLNHCMSVLLSEPKGSNATTQKANNLSQQVRTGGAKLEGIGKLLGLKNKSG